MQGSLRYKSVQNAKWRAETLSRVVSRQSVSYRPNTFSRHDKVFRPAQTLSHATTKCFVPPKHFLTPRQSVSSRPITFLRHGKVFRPAQTLSRATTKCFGPPNHFLTPRQSVSSCPNTFSRHEKVFGPVLSAKLGSLGIFANSLRPPPVATAQRTQTIVMDCDKEGGQNCCN